MEIIRTERPEIESGRELSNLLLKYTKTPVLLLVSGGSSLAVIEHCDTTLLGEHITLGLIDERFSPDPALRNYQSLCETEFFDDAMKYGIRVLDVSITAHESAQTIADRWEDQLRKWINGYPNGKIIAVLGIGEDGHTAGIMPGTYNVNFSGSALVVAYTVPKTISVYTDRITVTYTFLKEYVTEAWVYALGHKKQNIVDMLIAEQSDLAKTPACIFKEMKSVRIYTDK
jgi:6-phosphogluconolactonase/glucosamine-6-phosphate isomerase/deaminase